MPRPRKGVRKPATLGTEVKVDGDYTYTTTTDVLIGRGALVVTDTTVTTYKGEEVDLDSSSVALYHSEMDRLVELYQQYRKDHTCPTTRTN